MAWVLERSESEGSDRLVLLAIANHADARGGLAFPSVRQLALEARVDRATVYRSLARLTSPRCEGGLDELEVKSGGGRGHPNTYTLKGLQDATVKSRETVAERVAPCDETVASRHINGRTGATQNRPEPSLTIKPEKRSHSATQKTDEWNPSSALPIWPGHAQR